MKLDKHETPMIFRVLEGEVIALFPYEAAVMHDGGWLCTSFMVIGGHAAATPALVHRTRLARPEESKEIRNVLRKGYGYRIKELKRFPANARDVRRKQIEQMRQK